MTRAKRAGYLTGSERRWLLAENIAVGQGSGATAAAIVRQWMRSPGHRANVLAKQSRDAGRRRRGRAADRGSGRDDTRSTSGTCADAV